MILLSPGPAYSVAPRGPAFRSLVAWHFIWRLAGSLHIGTRRNAQDEHLSPKWLLAFARTFKDLDFRDVRD